ncbi:MAG: AAA family ATPase [Desulfovibrio sp.]|nr:AAA family ATPase [Desulfovibrio sp.]
MDNAYRTVLIDEIDKRLHIQLQKYVLPNLFNLFPNIQFILSSHSHFVAMGLFDNSQTKE